MSNAFKEEYANKDRVLKICSMLCVSPRHLGQIRNVVLLDNWEAVRFIEDSANIMIIALESFYFLLPKLSAAVVSNAFEATPALVRYTTLLNKETIFSGLARLLLLIPWYRRRYHR